MTTEQAKVCARGVGCLQVGLRCGGLRRAAPKVCGCLLAAPCPAQATTHRPPPTTHHRPPARPPQAEKVAAEAAAREAASAEGREYKAPPKEERIAIRRTIGRQAPVKYYVTGGCLMAWGGAGLARGVGNL